MNVQRNLGIALIVIGAGMLFFSNYIAEQVAAGRLKSKDSNFNGTFLNICRETIRIRKTGADAPFPGEGGIVTVA